MPDFMASTTAELSSSHKRKPTLANGAGKSSARTNRPKQSIGAAFRFRGHRAAPTHFGQPRAATMLPNREKFVARTAKLNE